MRLITYYRLIKWHVLTWSKLLINRDDLIKPYKMMVSVTNLCNSRCKTCFIWQEGINSDSSIQEFDLDEIEKVFDLLGDNLLWLSFTGGEPVLKIEKIRDILNLAKNKCPNLSLVAFTTNGLMPEQALSLAEIIKEAGMDSIITISLDGSKEKHDLIRGVKGNYLLAHRTKDLLDSKGFNTQFGTTISELNYEEFLFEGDPQIKAKAVTFAHDDGIYNKKNNLSTDVVVTILDNIIKKYRVSHLPEIIEYIYLKIAKKFFKNKRRENIVSCRSFYTTLDFTPDGAVKPCMFLEDEFMARDIDNDFFSRQDVKIVRNKVTSGQCSKCWMNCYAPHSIMFNPLESLKKGLF